MRRTAAGRRLDHDAVEAPNARREPTRDVYALSIANSGKLKLRAKGLLATGGAEDLFDACVLLHEAARIQQRAVKALPACPPATRLASSVEECWCYVAGRDPPRAAEAWGQVLREAQQVDAPTAEAILARVRPLFEASHRRFANAVRASQTLLATHDAGSFRVLNAPERAQARAELAPLLAEFPGATSFWWIRYRLAEADEGKKDAWDSLSRARRLDPENPRFFAMSLLVAAWALPRAEAENHLSPVREVLDGSGAEVCLMYAFGEINLARQASKAERQRRWQHGLDAVQAGLAQAASEGLRKNLKAAQLMLQDLLAGRTPTIEILYKAGLSNLAIASEPDADVAEVLTSSIRRAA